METWAPSVISGLFSIVVVIIGAVLISQRERNHREEDQERDDKNSQREAVARFIRAIEDLNAGMVEKKFTWIIYGDEKEHDWAPGVQFALDSTFYFKNFEMEISILDLHLHDPFVRKRMEKLKKVIKEEEKSYRRNVDFYSVPNASLEEAESLAPQLIEAITSGPDYGAITPHFNDLKEEARVRLRLKSAGGDEHPPMFTPPS